MERLIQYLDVLEDVFYAVALRAEQIRRIVLVLFAITITLVISGLGVILALSQPTAGLAVAALLTVMVLYRSATAHIPLVSPPLHG